MNTPKLITAPALTKAPYASPEPVKVRCRNCTARWEHAANDGPVEKAVCPFCGKAVVDVLRG